MKKIYLPLVATATLLAFALTVAAQTVTFTGANSSFWNNAGNWSTGTVPNNLNNVTIVIPSGQSAVVTGTYTFTKTTLKIQGSLQMGNGSGNGSSKGVINMDNQSAAIVESASATLKSKDENNSNNQLNIGGGTKFQGGNPEVTGPAYATASTTGFAAGSLPVVLLGFNAGLVADNKISIQWSTQQEISTDHFELQRSSDGLSWQTIAIVKASGYSSTQKNYSYQDNAPQTGTNLYRLRMIDFDAKFGFSGVVNVRLNIFGKVSVFPNPAVNTVNVSLGHVPASNWTLSMLNQSGQTIIRKIYSRDVTNVSLPVSIYPSGNYSIEITDGVSKQSSKLLIAHQ